MEPCPSSFCPWRDKGTGKTLLKPTGVKRLHYYIFFLEKALGLCYLRVPTRAALRLQHGEEEYVREVIKSVETH